MPEEQIPEIRPSIKDKPAPICATVQADLAAYYDGELPGPAEAAVGSHILKCSVCSRFLDGIKATGRLLAASFTAPAASTVDLWPQIKLRLGEDCGMVAAELSAYCDAELEPLRHRAITAHLTQCSVCSVEFLRITNLGEKLRSSYVPAVDSVNLWPLINQKLKVVPFRRRSRYDQVKDLLLLKPAANRRLAVAAAAASVIAFTGICISAVILQSNNVQPVSAETYLLDSLLSEMSNTAEAVVYEDRG